VVEGRAEVRKIIRIGRSAIAGSYVTDGRIIRTQARIWRGGKVIATDRIESLRRFRDDVREVAKDYECGIGLAGFDDLVEGDIIEAFSQQAVSHSALD
jgi:translation initiation factor IF-2